MEEKLRQCRIKILEMAEHSAHVAVSLSCIDILMILHHEVLNRPHDSFVLSKGHAAMAYYSTLHSLGELTDKDLKSYGHNNSLLAEHPLSGKLDSLEFATGSLGHGLSISAGMAMATKLDNSSHKSFVLLGDGECNEGAIWEAAGLAAAQGLDNLNAIVDWNNLQACGRWDELSRGSQMADMWQAFGWHVVELDGHNYQKMTDSFNQENMSRKPRVFLCRTVKGKGIDFMENNLEWHYRPVSAADRERAIGYLNA